MNLSEKIDWPPSGTYVVAVSGGSDSAALLDLLMTHPQAAQWQLVVAHFNHGWPGDDAYERVAREAIQSYDLVPMVERGRTERNEAAAREARYAFLRRAMCEAEATAIITAHHQDDLEETVLLNLLRGTGRRGLAPFRRTPDVVRPLVGVRKAALKAYANERGLTWCHDTYNDDLKFRRNYMRHSVIPQLEVMESWSHEIMTEITREATELNEVIDGQLAPLFKVEGSEAGAELALMRRLEPAVLTELIIAMTQAVRPGTELSRRSVEQLAIDVKTGRLRDRRRLANSLFATLHRDRVTIVFTP